MTRADALVADDTMVRLFLRGVPLTSLAMLYNRHHSTVRAALQRAGVDARTRTYTKRPAIAAPLPECPRCETLLSEAPAGDGTVCGYCVQDREEQWRDVYERLPGLELAA